MFLPGLLTYYGVLSLSPYVIRSLAIAGLLEPTLSGFIMTAVTEGVPGIRRLLGRIPAQRWLVQTINRDRVCAGGCTAHNFRR